MPLKDLTQVPDPVQRTATVLAGLDRCFLVGFGRLGPEQTQALQALGRICSATPLGEVVNAAVEALARNEFVEKHFAALAAGRAALQGAQHDALRKQAAEALGRTLPALADAPLTGDAVPDRVKVWQESVRHWLMEIAIAGFSQLDGQTLAPFAATLEQLQGEPLTTRLAALLTGFREELLNAMPIAALPSVPVFRWADLWTRAMVAALRSPQASAGSKISGAFAPLGVDLRHHGYFVSAVIYGLLDAGEPCVARVSLSSYKVDVVRGPEMWQCFDKQDWPLSAISSTIPLSPLSTPIERNQLMTRTTRTDSIMPRRAYSYRRISSKKQSKGGGLDRQADGWAETRCEQEGWWLDTTFSLEDKGKSGFHGKNLEPTAALGQFLAAVQSGRVSRGSILLVESLDRLSREEVGEAHQLVRGLLKAGITIVTRTPERTYEPGCENEMLTILEWLFIASRAHEESAMKSYRATKAWDAARAKGESRNRPPWWLQRTPAGYETIPEAVTLVQRIICLARTHGIGSIRKILTKEGIPAPTRSGAWTNIHIRGLITSRNALGESHCKDGRWLPIYPAIVTEEEWQQAQAALKQRKLSRGRPGSHHDNLFTGLAFVGETPLRMECKLGTGRKRYSYLKTEEGGWSLRYEAFESCILDTVAQLRPEDVLEPTANQGEREQRIAELTARLTKLDYKKTRFKARAMAAKSEQEENEIMAMLSEVIEEQLATAKECDALKLESRSGRAEALSEAQTLSQLRATAETREEREALDVRIKAALPTVVSRIEVAVKRVNKRKVEARITIHLRSGTRREAILLPVGRDNG